jgi:hypothetical protein
MRWWVKHSLSLEREKMWGMGALGALPTCATEVRGKAGRPTNRTSLTQRKGGKTQARVQRCTCIATRQPDVADASTEQVALASIRFRIIILGYQCGA